MSDQKDETKTEKPKAPKAPRVKMQHPYTGDWTCNIGGDEYPVTGGAVEVPEWHIAAAEQAGFRPA